MTSWIIVDNTNGIIVNRFDGDEFEAPEGQSIHIDDDKQYGIGGTLIDGVYTPPTYPDPITTVATSISRRQFFQQLAVDGIITEDQALASNAAVIPQPLLDIINQLPVDQRFDAKMKVSGATVFLRNDPLTIAIGQAYGMSDDAIDAFFLNASNL